MRSVPAAVVVVALVAGAACEVPLTASAEAIAPGGLDARIRVPRWTVPAPPPRTRFLYTFEDPEKLQAFRIAEQLDFVVKDAATPFDEARALGAWARAQFPPTKPDPYPPLSAPVFLAEIRAGRTGGFCAQYAALVVQGLASIGRYARHATIRDHEVIELYDDGWRYYDPQNDVWAVDENGKVLDGLSIHRRLNEEEPGAVVWKTGGAPKSDAWQQGYAAQVRGFYAAWLENAWTSTPHNFDDVQRSLLFWCPVATGCSVPDGASQTRYRPDFDAVPLDVRGYAARAGR